MPIISNITGPQGPPGSTWYTGNGAPSDSLGVDGDLYLDNTSSSYYEKFSGHWVFQGVLSSSLSIGPNNVTAPTYSTQVGGIDPNGLLESIKFDTNGALLVNTSGSFAVQDLEILFNEVAAIAVGAETEINTYTAPSGKISYLLSILNSGGNRGQFNIYNNGVLFDKQYTNVTQLTAPFDYKTGSSNVPGLVISAGAVISVRVINAGTSAADFNSRFMILEVA